jgi:hypothetical protein
MAGKKSKRGKTVKGRKVAKRVAKKTVLTLPPTLGKVVAAAVVQGMKNAMEKAVLNVTSEVETITPIQEPLKPESRLAYISSEQKHTKNLGNFESMSYGCGLTIPFEIASSDSIESAETRAKLRLQYEAEIGFLTTMLKEMGVEVDVARGAVAQ